MKVKHLGLWLFVVTLMVGCGAERDSALDPTDNDPGDSEGGQTAEPVNTVKLLEADQTLLAIDGNKQNLVFRDEDTYYLFLDRYTDSYPAYQPNFDQGQVALIDLGERPDGDCDYRLDIQGVRAEQVNDDLARLVVDYSERGGATTVGCDDTEAPTFRPFAFYYIETRDSLMISETIDD